jgi:hypothetical protein
MMMMARICFDRKDIQRVTAALRKRGYAVEMHVFDDEPEHAFAEASREVDTAKGVREAADGMLNDVIAIVEPFAGFVSDAGPVPLGHKPFEYETKAWEAKEDPAQKNGGLPVKF